MTCLNQSGMIPRFEFAAHFSAQNSASEHPVAFQHCTCYAILSGLTNQSNAGSTLLLLCPDAARQESPNACIPSTKECIFTAVDSWHLSSRFRKVFQRASLAPTPFNSRTYPIPDSITIRKSECAWRAAQLSRLSVGIGSGEGASPPQSTEECRFTAVDSCHLSSRFRNALQQASSEENTHF